MNHIILRLLQKSEDLAVSNIALKVEEAVKDLSGPIENMIPTHKDIMFSIKRDLVDSVTERAVNTSETQTSRRMYYITLCIIILKLIQYVNLNNTIL